MPASASEFQLQWCSGIQKIEEKNGNTNTVLGRWKRGWRCSALCGKNQSSFYQKEPWPRPGKRIRKSLIIFTSFFNRERRRMFKASCQWHSYQKTIGKCCCLQLKPFFTVSLVKGFFRAWIEQFNLCTTTKKKCSRKMCEKFLGSCQAKWSRSFSGIWSF